MSWLTWPVAVVIVFAVLCLAQTIQKWIEKKPAIEQARATRFVYCCKHAKDDLHNAVTGEEAGS
ncbi:hypothetical protein AB0M39_40160 [Streptomyces sp. NPDC051907]|uniref:hypothetical protein n=1 Tax=Streptomyces sp. NPDC051907 TaxID=3155284 RepID=UPI003438382A